MKRRDLLIADIRAKALMRQVMEKHLRDFAPLQKQFGNQPGGTNVSTPSPGTGNGGQAGTPPTLPPNNQPG